MGKADSILYIFPQYMRHFWGQAASYHESLQEIRLRVGKPVIVRLKEGEYFLDEQGQFSRDGRKSYRIEKEALTDILNQICHDSVYAYEDELKELAKQFYEHQQRIQKQEGQ